MHACLGRKQAVRIVTLDAECGRFNSCLASGLFIQDLDLEPFTLGPTQIHPQKHLAEILSICPAGTSLQRTNGAVRVRFAGKQRLHLGVSRFAFKPRYQRFKLDGRIRVGLGKFKQYLGVRDTSFKKMLLLQPLFDPAPLLDYFLCFLLIVPETRLGYLRFELF